MSDAVAIYGVEAYSFESSFPLRGRPEWLPEEATCEIRKTVLTAVLEGERRVYAFDFGALVFVNLPRIEVDRILEAVRSTLPREPHDPLREDFTLRIDPAVHEPEVTFDSVTIRESSALRLECVATVLAQSVSIDYYDEDLRAILERVSVIARDIAKAGRLLAPRRDLVRFVASSISSQVDMIASLSLLDKPDFTWDDEQAERLYDILRHHLEIQERFRALDKKLVTVRESLSQFLEINATTRALVLEALVVILIVFELLLSIAEHVK